MSCCVKSAVRKPLVQTARFNLILRQDKLYKAAFSAPVFWERGHLPPFQKRPGPSFCPYTRERPWKPPPKAAESVLFPPARGPRKSFQKTAEASSFSPKRGGEGPSLFPPARGPRKPFQKAAEASSFSPKRGGEGPSLFPPAGGLRKPPCFSQKEGLEILLASPLFRPLSCPLGRAFSPPSSPSCAKKRPGSSLSPPVKISSGLREGRAARKIPGLSSGFRLRVFRPACGASGLYRRNVRTRSVKFSVRPEEGFRHIRLAGRTGA